MCYQLVLRVSVEDDSATTHNNSSFSAAVHPFLCLLCSLSYGGNLELSWLQKLISCRRDSIDYVLRVSLKLHNIAGKNDYDIASGSAPGCTRSATAIATFASVHDCVLFIKGFVNKASMQCYAMHEIPWHGMVRHSTVWYGLVRNGMVW